MRDQNFTRWVRARGGYQIPVGETLAGAAYVIINSHQFGGLLQLQQTLFHASHSSGGGALPSVAFELRGVEAGPLEGSVKNSYVLSPEPLFICTDSPHLEWLYQEYLAEQTALDGYIADPQTEQEKTDNLQKFIAACTYSGISPDIV